MPGDARRCADAPAAVLLAVAAFRGLRDDEERRRAGRAARRRRSRPAPIDPNAPAAPATPTRACKRLGPRLVGVTLPAATARAERRGCALRVAVLDGEPQVLTEDYPPARINVRVRDNVVTGVEFMG